MGRGEFSPTWGQPPDKEPAAPQPSHLFLSEERLSRAGHGEKQGLPPTSGRPGLSLRAMEPCSPQNEGRFSLLPCAFLLATLQGAPDTLQRGTGRGGAGGGWAAARSREGGHRKAWPCGKNSATTGAIEGSPVTGLQFSGSNALKRLPLQSLHFAAGTPKPAKGGGPAQGCRDGGDTEGKQTQSSGGQLRALFTTPPTALPLSRPAPLPPCGQVSSEGKKEGRERRWAHTGEPPVTTLEGALLTLHWGWSSGGWLITCWGAGCC